MRREAASAVSHALQKLGCLGSQGSPRPDLAFVCVTTYGQPLVGGRAPARPLARPPDLGPWGGAGGLRTACGLRCGLRQGRWGAGPLLARPRRAGRWRQGPLVGWIGRWHCRSFTSQLLAERHVLFLIRATNSHLHQQARQARPRDPSHRLLVHAQAHALPCLLLCRRGRRQAAALPPA